MPTPTQHLEAFRRLKAEGFGTPQPTRYEIALYDGSERVRVLGYSARKTRGALLDFARANGPEIAARLTEAELDRAWVHRDGAVIFADRVKVAFSGWTERNPSTD